MHIQGSKRGFTIVELMVVIVAIGILAVIVIVSYNGATGKTRETAMKSDLENAASQLETDNQHNNGYPQSAAQVNNGQGFSQSTGTTLTYVVKPYGYCVQASNVNTSVTFTVRSSQPQIQIGTCSTVSSTTAGSGVNGFNDGAPGLAQFSGNATGIVTDGNGTLYVADSTRLRKIISNGTVSTLAGSSTAAITDGTGTGAAFVSINAITIDRSGTIYVLDSGRVRKVTADGTVATITGNAGAGYVNGSPAVAKFSSGAAGIAVNGSGTIYVADQNNNVIRKISPDKTTSTFSGTGTAGYVNGVAGVAQFNAPYGLAISAAGTLYVGDANRIRVVAQDGNVTTLAGSGTAGTVDGTGTAAQVQTSYGGLSTDVNGNIYLAEYQGNTIRVISPTGIVTTVAGSTAGYQDGIGSAILLRAPRMVVSPSEDTLYVIDTGNYRVRKIAL